MRLCLILYLVWKYGLNFRNFQRILHFYQFSCLRIVDTLILTLTGKILFKSSLYCGNWIDLRRRCRHLDLVLRNFLSQIQGTWKNLNLLAKSLNLRIKVLNILFEFNALGALNDIDSASSGSNLRNVDGREHGVILDHFLDLFLLLHFFLIQKHLGGGPAPSILGLIRVFVYFFPVLI